MRTVWRRDKSGIEFRPVGQAPQAHCPHPNFGNTDYSLHIEETREEDAGMYRCEVEGQNSKDVMLRVLKGNISPTHNYAYSHNSPFNCNMWKSQYHDAFIVFQVLSASFHKTFNTNNLFALFSTHGSGLENMGPCFRGRVVHGLSNCQHEFTSQ